MRRSCPLLLVLLSIALGSPQVFAQSNASAATFIGLVDGASIDPGDSIRWTTKSGAIAYYLYVGTAPGRKDIIDSGETQLTQWAGTSLPPGATVYARIHTKYANGWVSSAVMVTVRPVAVFTGAASRTTIQPNTRLDWTVVEGAQAYYLYVGSAPGLKDFINSGELQATSFSAVGIPPDRTAYARLHTLHGGVWRFVDATFDVVSIATFIAPLDNEPAFDPGANIRWSPVAGAEAYYLYVGTARGRNDLVDSGETLATGWPAMFIPPGQLVYARLHTKGDGVWRYTDTLFQVAPKSVFIEPDADGLELDPRVPLIWTDLPTAEAYYLYVGSAPGLRDIVDSGETSRVSFDISQLPRARTLYATLHTKAGGVWRQSIRSFQIAPLATIRERTDPSSEMDTRRPLQWTEVQGAEAYYLYVGTTRGAKDLVNTGEIHATQYSIDRLPAGTTVHVRLHTKHGGVWRYVESVFQTKAVAYLDGDVAASGTWQAGTPLTWTPFAGASKYYAYIGTAAGKLDISSSGEIAGTTFTMPWHHAAAIASDRDVHVRLYSLVGERWNYVDYSLRFLVASELTFPVSASSNVDVTALRTTWYSVTGATKYRLEIGTSPGAADVFSSADIEDTEVRTNALPGGRTLYSRLWTYIAGEWRHTDSAFVTRAAAAFVNPRHGEVRPDLSTGRIEWMAVPGADLYRVEFGSAPGSTDLLQSAPTIDTSITADESLTTAIGVVYGRVWTRHSGIWRFSDSVFTTSDPEFASMIWESDESDFHAREGFRWTEVPMATAYRLRLGTTPGGTEIHDSGPIRTSRRLIDDLPEGIVLFGELETVLIDGTRLSSGFQFTVTDAAIDFDDRWEHALWATAEVRGMAASGNLPLPNSLLLDFTRSDLRDSAYCSTYALTEAELLRQSNIGIEARILNVCLNTNRYDCHTLIEVLDPATGRWRLLDPTFGMAVQRASDGDWATSLDVFEATRDLDFDRIEYIPLTDRGMTYAEGYYLDYPILFAKVLKPYSIELLARVDSVVPYYYLTGLTAVSTAGLYAIRCTAGGASVSIKVVGAGSALAVDENNVASIPCDGGSQGFSHIFNATLIEPVDDFAAYEIAIPRRFVFH